MGCSIIYLAKGGRNGLFKAPLSWKKEEGMGISIIYLAKGGRNGLFQAPFSLAKGGKWVVPLFTVPGQRRKERVVPLFSWQKKEGRGVVPGSPFPGKGMKEWVILLVTWQKEEGMGYSRRPSPWQRPGGMGYSIIYLAKGGRMGCSIIYLAKGERKRGCSRLPFPWQSTKEWVIPFLPGKRRKEWVVPGAPLPGKGLEEWVVPAHHLAQPVEISLTLQKCTVLHYYCITPRRVNGLFLCPHCPVAWVDF